MRYVVPAPLHVPSVDQVSASTGDDVAAADVHGDAHHPVRGHATAGGGDHCGDVTPTALRVEVAPPTALAIQLSLRVVGVGRSAGERQGIRTSEFFLFYLYDNLSIISLTWFHLCRRSPRLLLRTGPEMDKHAVLAAPTGQETGNQRRKYKNQASLTVQW